MVNIGTSKISSRGQVVIPKNMRKHFKEGEEVVFIENEDNIIIKTSNNTYNNFESELKSSQRVKEAYERYEKNPESFKKMEFDDFIQYLKDKI
jgi:AbrB family looped-hinge helix DNA binding protein